MYSPAISVKNLKVRGGELLTMEKNENWIHGDGNGRGKGLGEGQTSGVFGRYPIVPPINSTRDLHIDRPNPVPLYRFVALLSICVNGVKRLFTALNGIPTVSSGSRDLPKTARVTHRESKKEYRDDLKERFWGLGFGKRDLKRRGDIPTPVSVTSVKISTLFSVCFVTVTSTSTVPNSVNLTAFPRMF